MRVKIHREDYGDVVAIGDLDKITLGSDGVWVHLSHCDGGLTHQSFSLDHPYLVRPIGELDGKALVFVQDKDCQKLKDENERMQKDLAFIKMAEREGALKHMDYRSLP